MTLNQLNTLTDDEVGFVLYIVNKLNPPPFGQEIPEIGLTWFRKGALEQKIQNAFPYLKHEAHPVFSSILNKLDVKHEIKYEQPSSGSL